MTTKLKALPEEVLAIVDGDEDLFPEHFPAGAPVLKTREVVNYHNTIDGKRRQFRVTLNPGVTLFGFPVPAWVGKLNPLWWFGWVQGKDALNLAQTAYLNGYNAAGQDFTNRLVEQGYSSLALRINDLLNEREEREAAIRVAAMMDIPYDEFRAWLDGVDEEEPSSEQGPLPPLKPGDTLDIVSGPLVGGQPLIAVRDEHYDPHSHDHSHDDHPVKPLVVDANTNPLTVNDEPIGQFTPDASSSDDPTKTG